MTDLYEGLKKTSPKPPEETPKGGSVNSEPTRSSTAPSPKSLGPRTA